MVEPAGRKYSPVLIALPGSTHRAQISKYQRLGSSPFCFRSRASARIDAPCGTS